MLQHSRLQLEQPAFLAHSITWVIEGSICAGRELRVDRLAEIVAYAGASLTFGSGCYVGHSSTIAAHERITIGSNVMIADFVTIRDHEHRFDQPGLPIRAQGVRSAAITIGDNVWIGSKATITSGVALGDSSVIGANSVVTHDVPPFSIVGGVPARLIGEVPRPQ
jgi:acetyltransferase-like isoleucine patch superfamily enzyme